MIIPTPTLAILLLGITANALAMEAPNENTQQGLFADHSVLELTIPVDFDTLCKPSEDPGCTPTRTVMEFRDADGATVGLPVNLSRRDGWRAQQTTCQVPTLFVEFDTDAAIGTPFEGQKVLALTSHCGKGVTAGNSATFTLPDEFERYVVNEYLGYRLYNLVTEASLRVRLARIRYVDPNNPRREFTRDAFFAEHFDALAKRLNAEAVPASQIDPERMDWQAYDELALFQYMIGNTDWSLSQLENILLLQTSNGRQVPVLFDLDKSGLVNAHYARPRDGLPIAAVTERYFMGYCRETADWDALFAKFSELDPDSMKMLVDTPGLGRGDRRATALFLDRFFEVLDQAETRDSMIRANCLPMPVFKAGTASNRRAVG